MFRSVDTDFCLSLDTTPGHEYVCAEYGDISIGSKKLKIGERHSIKTGDNISVANLSFDYLQHGEAPLENKDASSSGLALFIGGLLLTGGSALAIVGSAKKNVVEVNATPLPELLSEASLDSLEIVEKENDQVRIVGMLNDRSEQDTLQEIVAGRPEVIHLYTKTEKQLIDDVTEFYRINDVPASVTRNEDKSMLVVTEEPDLGHLDEIEEKIKNDNIFVDKIVRDNTVEEVVKKKRVKKNPDDEVLMVVAGDSPHVVTRGGGRYFVGSVLPSGEVIDRIDINTVVLKKGKDELVLTF